MRASLLAVGLALAAGALAGGCERRDPPGRTADSPPAIELSAPTVVIPLDAPELPAAEAPSPTAKTIANPDELEPGHGAKLASIAMRTWIYDSPDAHGRKLGYLRAGAVIDRAERSAGTDNCAGGWYRVEPRGYACVGKGATLDVANPIVQAATRGPHRGEPTPYSYVMSASPGPHLYFRLPSESDQKRVEGATYATHAALHQLRLKDMPVDPVPQFLLDGNNLPIPYGSEKNLSYSVHRGRASDHSAFGLITVFDWTGRRFGLTTELDLIPLDRTKPAIISELRGVKLEHGGRPAFTVLSGANTYKRDANGQFIQVGLAKGRSGWELTGENQGGDHGMLETTTGLWLAAQSLTLGILGKDRAHYAERGRKWISVSIEQQMLIAYEGTTPVYAALVSTGRGGMSDPAESFATVRGTFLIRSKHVSGTMDGNESSDDAFDLRDVPYIQYFHEGYALHAAYWHDEFGKVRSHGCINLAPADAAWLFDWTEPEVPTDWHGAVRQAGGTLVYIHR
ncbi:MAG: L,D-transpeptidase [Polyangiaceae bacterium]